MHNESGEGEWKYVSDNDGEYDEKYGYFHVIVILDDKNNITGAISINQFNTSEEAKEKFKYELLFNTSFDFSIIRFGNVCIDAENQHMKLLLKEMGYDFVEGDMVQGKNQHLYRDDINIDIRNKIGVLKNKGYNVIRSSTESGFLEGDEVYCIISPLKNDVCYVMIDTDAEDEKALLKMNKILDGCTPVTCVVAQNNTIWWCRSEESFNKLIADINGG